MSTTIPLFPLGSPLFPGMAMPLHIFEPRYRQLVADLLEGVDAGAAAWFGVVAIRAGHEVGADAATALADVGCLADVRAVAALPDGRYELLAVGARRFRLARVISGQTPYLQADVDWIDETEGPQPQQLARRAAAAFAVYRTALDPTADGPDTLPADPTLLSYALGAAVLLTPADRQRVLACPDTTARLQLLLRLMEREQALLGQLHAVPDDTLLRSRMSPN